MAVKTERENRHHPGSAWVPSSFSLTVCLEVILRQNYQINNQRKSEVTLLHQPRSKSGQDAKFETENK